MGILHPAVAGAVIGIGASLLMDAWNLLLLRVFRVPSLNYCLLGRWVRHMPGGTFRHDSIVQAAPQSQECTVGWLSHYGIGATLGLLFVVVFDEWLAHPSLAPALVFGVATVVLPYFVLQPALGLGVASARAVRPAQARLKSLGTHAVFGVGLYLTALLLTRIP